MTAPDLASFHRWRPLLDGLAGDIHPDRWKAASVGTEGAAKLAANPRARRLLSLRLDWLEPGAEGQETTVWPDWTSWEKNRDTAALLSGTDLVRGGRRLGAAVFRPEIAMVILGKQVAALKAAIGADAYFFTLRQAGLVKETGGLSRERIGEGDLADRVHRVAEYGLAAWLGSLPVDLAKRVALKLPPAIDAARSAVAAWPAEERERWRAALARVFFLGL